ncbi:IS3 family transposase [Aridibaculum aurantiacum]|uniref:IS3 family transposase n=1 Tax=Aridibaculum aurantiacum TaxID=2810307 RepID=UPI001F60A9B0|nr:IS3 family transposase [Aridibaculum aurantiacum]
MCKYWQVSRQAFYKVRKCGLDEQHKAAGLLVEVKQVRRDHVKLGGRKLYHELREDIRRCGRGFGRDKFFDLLRQHDLLVKRKRKYAVTTQSDHPFYKYHNELSSAEINAPNQAWVSDITYLRTRKGFAYLSLITDAYSRKVVGWNVDSSLGVESTLKAVAQAISQSRQTEGIIHHSDRGIQYCCYAYTDKLKQKGIKISMGEAGNCYDNALAERMNGILKDEYLLDAEFLDLEHAKQATRQAIYLYNHKRPHWSLGLQKPAEVHVADNQPVVKEMRGRLALTEQDTASF